MIKSKDKIADALLILLETKKEYEITNNEIINKAGISKGTFYNHFSGKYEVGEYIFDREDNKIMDKINDYKEYFKTKNITSSVIIDIFAEHALPMIYRNRERLRILYKGSLSDRWKDFIEMRYIRFLKKCNFNVSYDDFDVRLAINYTLNIICLWISSPIPETPEKFQEHFKHLFNIKIKDILNLEK
ncbi:TetR/AcrR family transcriptional regulator [Nicoliella lavandulae]|uniref:TetR/AcrR family transcriptional regulator n=1 Tax=Nicoliella lavandulae TaxID=3082954 RepID=A0ABU8SKQ9_9LACO